MTAMRRRYRRDPSAIVPEAWTDPWPAGQPTHRQLVDLWLEIGHALGYRISVMHDSRGEHWGADSGWPDLFAVRDGRAYAIEIKVPPDEPTDEQRTWLRELDRLPGVTAAIFRSCGDRARDMAVIADILRAAPPVLPRAGAAT